MELTSQNGVANSHGLATCACIVSHSIQYTWQLVRSDLHVCDVVLLESASNVLKKAVELVHHCILSLKGNDYILCLPSSIRYPRLQTLNPWQVKSSDVSQSKI
ncbi:uncharacterized protein [Montipora capricornis]